MLMLSFVGYMKVKLSNNTNKTKTDTFQLHHMVTFDTLGRRHDMVLCMLRRLLPNPLF